TMTELARTFSVEGVSANVSVVEPDGAAWSMSVAAGGAPDARGPGRRRAWGENTIVTENNSVQDGGEEPLAAILDAQAEALEKFIAGWVRGDPHAVEDVLQETIMGLMAFHDRKGGLPAGEEAVRRLL